MYATAHQRDSCRGDKPEWPQQGLKTSNTLSAARTRHSVQMRHEDPGFLSGPFSTTRRNSLTKFNISTYATLNVQPHHQNDQWDPVCTPPLLLVGWVVVHGQDPKTARASARGPTGPAIFISSPRNCFLKLRPVASSVTADVLNSFPCILQCAWQRLLVQS